jgi:hypothetical protein
MKSRIRLLQGQKRTCETTHFQRPSKPTTRRPWFSSYDQTCPRSRRTAIAHKYGRRTELASRDLSHVRVRAANCRGLPETDGADPLLGFHLPRVFSPPAMATPNVRPPLTHLNSTDIR